MNSILFILFVSMFFLCSAFLQAEWTEYPQYKELKLSEKKIKQILSPPDCNYYYAVDADNIFYKFDSESGLIEQKKLSVSGFSYLKSGIDGRTALFQKRKDTTKYEDFWDMDYSYYYVAGIDIESETEMFNRQIVTSKTTPFKPWTSYSPSNIDFSDSILVFIQKKEWVSSGPGGNYTYNGDGKLISTTTGATSGFSAGYSTSLSPTKDCSKILLLRYTKDEIVDNYGSYFGESRQFALYLKEMNQSFIISENYEGTGSYSDLAQYGYIPERFNIAHEQDFFVSSKADTLNIYNYTVSDDNVKFTKNEYILNYIPTSMVISKDDRFLLLANPDYSIDIIKLSNMVTVQSINLLDSLQSSVIKYSEIENAILLGNDQGVIKYIYVDSILSVNENKKSISMISPNPATDYISLKNYNGYIEIYNIFGLKVKSVSDPEIIDISELQEGVYFIKTDNEYYKFIKLK